MLDTACKYPQSKNYRKNLIDVRYSLNVTFFLFKKLLCPKLYIFNLLKSMKRYVLELFSMIDKY